MLKILCYVLITVSLLLESCERCSAFSFASRISRSRGLDSSRQTEIDPSSCSFQEALAVGSSICDEIQSSGTLKNPDVLPQLLSHANGVRGFFANYLTDPSLAVADAPEIPDVLSSAIASDDLSAESARVYVMNAVMPTAMVLAHKDPEQSRASAITARRGGCVLLTARKKCSLVEHEWSNALKAAQHIISCDDNIASGGNIDEAVKFWIGFYEKWGYDQPQMARITTMLRDL